MYFVPGYIFLLLAKEITMRKISRTTEILLSCSISFILVSTIQMIFSLIPNVGTNLFWVVTTLSILISAILAGIFGKIYNSEKFHRKFENVFKIILKNRIWENVIDYENGTKVKVYMKDKNFYYWGDVDGVEDNEENSYFCIRNPIKIEFDSNKSINDIESDSKYMVVSLKDVEYIEFG